MTLAFEPGVHAPPTRPPVVRAEAQRPLPAWPLVGLIALHPLWFILGLSGFSWVAFSLPMAAALVRRRDLLLPRGSLYWLLFLIAVVGSFFSIDSGGRMMGWALRFGYYLAATIVFLYVLNGRKGLPTTTIVRSFIWLWLATVAGGYLAFVLGDLSFRSPVAYLMPGSLLDNDLIGTMVTPSFADLQDIIGVPVPRPKAPFPYTNSWGSMLALLTPFALIGLNDRSVGVSPRLLRFGLAASVLPAVISLNRGLWLSLGIGLLYGAVRLGLAGGSKALRNLLIVLVAGAVIFTVTPLGGIVETRVETGHSNNDRLELITDAISGTMERPIFGWGGPRPNDRNLPSVGTHGQAWFVMFSYGFVGFVGYLGFLLSQAWRTRSQPSAAGLWAHTVIIIGLAQMPYYLQVPQQMFTILVAAALAIRLRHPGQARLADR
ncbi:MAG: O-antigen ligase family protein [Acidimicrobiales bacterium]